METTSRLANILYPAPDLHRTNTSLLRWWESRRPLYNVIVGGTGLITLTVLFLFAAVPGGAGLPNTSGVALAVFLYGVCANICFTLGWMFEMLAKAVWGDRAPHIGPFLFREGLLFSVGLTLLPIPIAMLGSIVRIVL